MDNKEIADVIRDRRISKGLTQKQLSEQTGLALITIKQYENGKRVPNLINSLLLADILNFSIYCLFDWHGIDRDRVKRIVKQLECEL